MANDKLQVSGFFIMIMLIFSFGPLRNQANVLWLNEPSNNFYYFLAQWMDLILLTFVLLLAGLLMYDLAVKSL
jgi:hypothetical protein